MKLEEFNALTDEEKETYLSSFNESQKSIDDLNAEISSFKSENEELRKQLETNKTELTATKEMNFTLARKINREPAKDSETILHNIIKEFN